MYIFDMFSVTSFTNVLNLVRIHLSSSSSFWGNSTLSMLRFIITYREAFQILLAKLRMQMLTASDGGAALNNAAQQAANGNTEAISQLLKSVLNSPQGAELAQRINQSLQK